ncbi:helix-turn-helix domain-containing protein [Microbacterium aquimaris]|uniref:Helix-turn-helix transcriptional regulator n=1 Tax=Microbacterium aquimaris TaxID=459816 RepID=A0ABU5N5A2_9MICO|nr:helix-turn-helix transcriptional regulator [Microbacterium aquimaris]MDZ8161264.1 helix-turn-helix transcriptional regulator [Microbacterium aquimaris]
MRPESSTPNQNSLDDLVSDLQRLRLESGDISYSQIAERVRSLREERGDPPAAAFVGRSTIYDAFRPGRRRMNPSLVADIAAVLGEDADAVDAWREACIRARYSAPTSPNRPPAEGGAPRGPSRPADEVPSSQPAPFAEKAYSTRDTVRAGLFVIVVGVIVNLTGSGLVIALPLPIYLDMIGTAITAMVVGPWAGVAVAVLTHGAFALVDGVPDSLWFTFVNATGALIWGYGARTFGLARSPLRMLFLTSVVALCCSVVAVALMIAVYGGFSLHGEAQRMAEGLVAGGYSPTAAMLTANLITSETDKLVSGFVALIAAPALARALPPFSDSASEVFGVPGVARS